MRVVRHSSQPGKAGVNCWLEWHLDAGFPQVLALTDKGAMAMQGFPGGRTTLRRCRDSRRCRERAMVFKEFRTHDLSVPCEPVH